MLAGVHFCLCVVVHAYKKKLPEYRSRDEKYFFSLICVSAVSAISAFVKATIRENGMPFVLKAADDPYIYSEENMKYLRKSINQLENGKGKAHELKEIV